jgi:ribokinase
MALVDVLTPNESEALVLLGIPPARVRLQDGPALTRRLRERGASAVILKLGDQGCLFDDGMRQTHYPAFPVEVKDTTAAGDVFNGALAVALGEGKPIDAALGFANAAAALSVTRPGAQASIPTRAEVDYMLTR